MKILIQTIDNILDNLLFNYQELILNEKIDICENIDFITHFRKQDNRILCYFEDTNKHQKNLMNGTPLLGLINYEGYEGYQRGKIVFTTEHIKIIFNSPIKNIFNFDNIPIPLIETASEMIDVIMESHNFEYLRGVCELLGRSFKISDEEEYINSIEIAVRLGVKREIAKKMYNL